MGPRRRSAPATHPPPPLSGVEGRPTLSGRGRRLANSALAKTERTQRSHAHTHIRRTAYGTVACRPCHLNGRSSWRQRRRRRRRRRWRRRRLVQLRLLLSLLLQHLLLVLLLVLLVLLLLLLLLLLRGGAKAVAAAGLSCG